MTHSDNSMTKNDYTMARRAGSNDEYEKIVGAEGPYEEDGTMGPDDMFKLEFSGWCDHVEFKRVG